MKKQTVANNIEAIIINLPKGFQPVNMPKANSVTIACMNIASIVAQGAKVENLTPMGHIANCKGGVIDTTILSGKVHSLESFIDSLLNSGLKVVKSDIQKYGMTDTCRAVLAKRVVDHVSWCANTLNQSHGGFNDRLAKVSLQAKRADIAANLVELAGTLQKQFSAQYSKLYKNR